MSANVSINNQLLHQVKIRRGYVFGFIIITALFAFEIFNYSTTEYALSDLLGGLEFAGIRWATILSIAFCGIDFAGIARLFTPRDNSSKDSPSHNETWYLFGAWLLAATMNAMLTWWGVSLAILGHETLGNAVVERTTLLRIVPVFVSLLVWLSRVLIIGTFSVAGDRLFAQEELRPAQPNRSQQRQPLHQTAYNGNTQSVRSNMQAASANRSTYKNNSSQVEPGYSNNRELTYHQLHASPTQTTPIHTDPVRNGGNYRN